MVTYVSLNNFTKKGAQEIKNFPQWADEVGIRMEELGVEVLSWHLVMGAYDEVVVWTAPSDEVAVAFLLEIGSYGRQSTVTLRAFNFDEAKAAIDLVP